MENIEEALRAGFAAQGENIFYTLSSAEQRDFLRNVQNRLYSEKGNKGFEVCDNGCSYGGSLLCEFCEAFDEGLLKDTLQRLNNMEIPSSLELVF